MTGKIHFNIVIIIAISLLFVAQVSTAQNTLEVRRVTTAPVMDAAVDSLWQQATPMKVSLSGGRNFPGGRTEITLRAVTQGETVYFLAQYADATESFRRSPFVKQSDGTWLKIKDPNDKGGDNNVFYEDKLAFVWAINSPGFERAGCMISCHAGEAGKPYGNKYLPAGETADIWHAKLVRTLPVGQIDDQYLDSTTYDKDKSPEAGRTSDAKTGGGYADIKLVNGRPEFALPGNQAAPPYWLLDSQKVAFDDSKYAVGAEVPSILVAPFTGDRGDIPLAAKWTAGVWTLEFSRKLVTGSATDVQFADRTKTYSFGVAAFDNAQVRHAFHPGVLKMAFKD